MEIKQYENYFNFSLYQCVILIFIGNIIKDWDIHGIFYEEERTPFICIFVIILVFMFFFASLVHLSYSKNIIENTQTYLLLIVLYLYLD